MPMGSVRRRRRAAKRRSQRRRERRRADPQNTKLGRRYPYHYVLGELLRLQAESVDLPPEQELQLLIDISDLVLAGED